MNPDRFDNYFNTKTKCGCLCILRLTFLVPLLFFVCYMVAVQLCNLSQVGDHAKSILGFILKGTRFPS